MGTKSYKWKDKCIRCSLQKLIKNASIKYWADLSSFLVSLRFVSEWKNSIQFVQWLGGLAKLIRKLCSSRRFWWCPTSCKITPGPLSFVTGGYRGGCLNYAAPQEHRVWQSCNWSAPMIGSEKLNFWNLFQQICKHSRFKKPTWVIWKCKTFLKKKRKFSMTVVQNWSQISNCPVGVTRPPIPTLVWVLACCWSVIDQFPPHPPTHLPHLMTANSPRAGPPRPA